MAHSMHSGASLQQVRAAMPPALASAPPATLPALPTAHDVCVSHHPVHGGCIDEPLVRIRRDPVPPPHDERCPQDAPPPLGRTCHSALVIFARLPVPGVAKTRLAAGIGAEAAAAAYKLCAEAVFAAAARCVCVLGGAHMLCAQVVLTAAVS